jgi:hypothetical protein
VQEHSARSFVQLRGRQDTVQNMNSANSALKLGGPDIAPVGAQIAALNGALGDPLQRDAVGSARHPLRFRGGLPLPHLRWIAAQSECKVADGKGVGLHEIVVESHLGADSGAIATGTQAAFATVAAATFPDMADDTVQAHRRARFQALIRAKPYEGNLSELGRALKYKDGVYVRQMRDGKRPITEKTVAKLEALPGKAGWFGSEESAMKLSPAAVAIAVYFDRQATKEERALIARMLPLDIDLTEQDSRYGHEGGINTGLGSLDEAPHGKKGRK